MIKKLIPVLLVLHSLNGSGQTLSPVVVASAGNYFSAGSATLEFTVGELTMVQTFSSGSSILTQGFHQTLVSAVGVDEPLAQNIPFVIYPNPASGILYVNMNLHEPSSVIFKMFDAQAKLVMRDEWNKELSQSLYRQSFDITSLAPGIYFAQIITTNSSGTSQLYNHKISIIK